MKQLTCEMCGSNDLIKQDGVFVCQSCGCKYSVEEAKKMMVEGTVEVTGTVKVDTSGDSENLYRLGCLALEDGDWKKADKFFDDALSINAEYAECYLGKLMAELCVRKKEDLKDCEVSLDSSNNYKKAIRFGDEKMKAELSEYTDFIKSRNKENAYNYAIGVMNDAGTEQAYLEAAKRFERIGNYKDAESLAKECREKAETKRIEAEKKRRAYNVRNIRHAISAGGSHTVGLKSDGTVVAIGINICGECNVSKWSDIVSISAGNYNTVGLKSDGTVVAAGDNECGKCDVSGWKDIVSVSVGEHHTIGLKSDGTVAATKIKDVFYNRGQCNVSYWRDIVAISAGANHTVGLKTDGTVVAVGNNKYGQCDVSYWRDIVAIYAGEDHTVGLKSDGSVVAVGFVAYGQCDVSDWKDIVAISAGADHTVGLKSDGTVVATKYDGIEEYYRGQCDVSGWRDIVAISAGANHTVGLKTDGTVVAVGNNKYGQCNVSNWRNIALPPKETTLEELFAREKREHEERLKIEQERQEQERLAREKQEQERLAREEKERQERLAKEKQMADYRNRGVCQHCGGEFKGLFSKTCTKCGRKKDY